MSKHRVRLLPVDPILATADSVMSSGGGRANPISPLDLCRFYRHEREFYGKLVRQLGLDPERIKWVMSLWIWFESMGHHDFIRHVSACASEDVILGLIREAVVCLDYLVGHFDPSSGRELPLTCSLTNKPIDLGFFDLHRITGISKVTHFHNKVANVLFDDRAIEEEAAARDAGGPVNSKRVLLSPGGLQLTGPFGEGSSLQGAAAEAGQAVPVLWRLAEHVVVPQAEVGPAMPEFGRSAALVGAAPVMPAAGVVQSRLNPMAAPWSPTMNYSPDDRRSVFTWADPSTRTERQNHQ